MAHLCDLKLSASITPDQLRLWHVTLGCFSVEVVNTAALMLAVTPGKFPDFSDLYALCSREARRRGEMEIPYSPHGTGNECNGVTLAEIKQIAERLGLDV